MSPSDVSYPLNFANAPHRSETERFAKWADGVMVVLCLSALLLIHFGLA